MTEQSTKYCIIAPLLTKNAEKVIDKLETHLFQYFGYPKRIYTDNGTEFSNLKMTHLVKSTALSKGLHHSTMLKQILLKGPIGTLKPIYLCL